MNLMYILELEFLGAQSYLFYFIGGAGRIHEKYKVYNPTSSWFTMRG